MEDYGQFLERINSFEKQEMELPNEDFSVNPSLKKKVDDQNCFRPFFGDTVAFDLDSDTKKKVEGIVDVLYTQAGECFCERLRGDTFHITLHDLSNSPSLSEAAEEVFVNELRIIDAVKRANIGCEQLTMQSNNVFNMVGTSLCLGVKPKGESDYKKLMKLYSIIDEVKSLPYPFTPHITLAYYNCRAFSRESAECLTRAVNIFNKEPFEFTVSTDKLYYQKFTDMNTYVNIFPLIRMF